MSDRERPYISYLLRLWVVESVEGPVWRASVQQPRTDERHGFASLEELFSFLREATGAPPDIPAPEDEKRRKIQ